MRHKEAMKQIKEEGERRRREMEEKFIKDLEKMSEDYSKMLNCKPAPVRYKDKDGMICELDITDKEAIRKVMSDRSNKLIF